MEDLLEVQPEPGWRCHIGCVSGKVLKGQHSETSFRGSSTNFIQTDCVLAVTTSQRSASLSPAWFCFASMSQCCAGAVTVTTACTRPWWRSSSLMCSGPFPVRPYNENVYQYAQNTSWLSSYKSYHTDKYLNWSNFSTNDLSQCMILNFTIYNSFQSSLKHTPTYLQDMPI